MSGQVILTGQGAFLSKVLNIPTKKWYCLLALYTHYQNNEQILINSLSTPWLNLRRSLASVCREELETQLKVLQKQVALLQKKLEKPPLQKSKRSFWWQLSIIAIMASPVFAASLMNGSFGIGINPPVAKLHVRQTAAADSFVVEDSNSDTTPFVIDQAGDVGIGTTSPAAKLDVQGAAQFGSANINLINATGKIPALSSTYFASVSGANLTNLNADNISSGTLADARLESTLDRTNFNASNYVTALGGVHVGGSSDPGTDNLLVDGTATLGGNLIFNTASVAYADQGAWATDNEKWLSFETSSPRRIHFWAPDNAGANFQTITLEGTSFGGHGGYVGINTPDPSHELEVTGNAAKTTGTNWTSISDRRKKKNIQPLKNTLDTMLALRGVSFYWRKAAEHGNLTGKQRGFIAQEVEKVIPEWVITDQQGYKWLSPVGSLAMTLEAIRELKQRQDTSISALQEENKTLRAQIQQIQEQLNTIALKPGG